MHIFLLFFKLNTILFFALSDRARVRPTLAAPACHCDGPGQVRNLSAPDRALWPFFGAQLLGVSALPAPAQRRAGDKMARLTNQFSRRARTCKR